MPDIYNMSDVFISYSRKDSAFVRRLFDGLKARGKEVWADFEDIPKAADWWQEIQAGINAADSFVFVISPDSVRSDVCRQEVDHAVASSKRLIPLLYREVTEAADKEKIHPAISAHNWIFCRESDDFDASFGTLLQALETDLEHNRTLTRLLVRAREWESKNRSSSYLLRGDDLRKAEEWLAAGLHKEPAPTALHIDYINASRRAEVQQQRQRLGLMTGGFVISLVLAVLALFMWTQANTARAEAEAARAEAEVARDIARVNERKARSLGLASSADEALVNHNPDLALTLALKAVEVDNSQPQILSSLADAVYSPGTARVIPVGEEAIFATAYHPDGSIVAAGTDRGNVCLWEVDTGQKVVCAADAHQDTVIGLVFIPDGHELLSASTDGTARLWNMNPQSERYGQEIHRFTCRPVQEGDTCKVLSMALSRDGQIALFGTNDGLIAVWSPLTGKIIRYMDNRPLAGKPVTALAISSSGLRALSGTQDGRLLHWYINKGDVLSEMMVRPDDAITSVAFNPGGQIGVTGGRSGLIMLWELEATRPILSLNEHEEAVTSLVFHPADGIFFSSSWDNRIIEWDARNGREVRTFYGHDGGINSVTVRPDGEFIASGGYDTEIRTWSVLSVLTEERLITGQSRIQGMAYLPGAGFYASAQTDGDVFLFDAATDTRLRTFQGYGIAANDVALSLDGRYLAVVYQDNRLMLRDLQTGQRLWAASLIDVTKTNPHTVLFSRDGTFVLAGFFDGWAWYDTATGTKIGSVAFGRDPATTRQVSVRAVALHPDGKRLLVGLNSLTNNLQLVNLTTGEVLHSFAGHRDGVLAVDFNQDGTWAVSGSFDTDVRLWEVETGRKLRVFSGHSDRVTAVAFSPNEALIVSGSNDRTLRLWDTDTGFERYRYVGHTDRVTEVRFSEDGRTIMSSGLDGDLFLWRLPQPLPEMVAWAKASRYVRDLTCSERNLYLSENLVCDE